MLKPEEILGKMYQPVEVPAWDKTYSSCDDCVLNKGTDCEVSCLPGERDDKLNIYYINIEGE